MSRYYLRRNRGRWREVSRDGFIAAEREAGFIPKSGCGPLATAGFGISGPDLELDGRIEGMDDELSELEQVQQ